MRLAVPLVAVALLIGVARGAYAFSPHSMTNDKGEADLSKCGICHNPDFSLQRSKSQTCTICHALSTHSGSREHVSADPAIVGALLGDGPNALPTDEKGGIYCGTCHLFHDPALAITPERALDEAWRRSDAGLGGAVGKVLLEKGSAIAVAHGVGGEWGEISDGTRMLRLGVADDALCVRCHAGWK